MVVCGEGSTLKNLIQLRGWKVQALFLRQLDVAYGHINIIID